MNVQAGDIVNLSPGAVYYTGKEMPGWVKNDKWIVKSVEGDRAVLGKNESGSHEINSPVHIKYLNAAVITGGTTQQQEASTVQAGVASGEMSVSDRGVELIAKYEGCRLEAYKCPAGVWTIGYGHTEGVY